MGARQLKHFVLLVASFAVALAAPTAQADDDVRQWSDWIGDTTRSTITSNQQHVFQVEASPHHWNVTKSETWLQFTASYSWPSGIVTTRIGVSVNLWAPGHGSLMACQYEIRSATGWDTIRLDCGNTTHRFQHGIDYRIAINSTVLTGSGDVDFATYSFVLHHRESVTMDLHVTTEFDFISVFLPFIVWLAYIAFLVFIKDPPVRLIYAAMGLFILFMPMHAFTFWALGIAQVILLLYVVLQRLKGGNK